jgi:serine/threonine-protein kinase HipA
MRKLEVYRNGVLAGILTEENRQYYLFRYDEAYFNDPSKPPISLTLPKSQLQYEATSLFPFFFNMLSEGVNRRLQSRLLKIDEADHFGLLAATAQWDTIGAVTVKPVTNDA